MAYVTSLEQHVAELEVSLQQQISRSTSGRLFGASHPLPAPCSTSPQIDVTQFSTTMFQDASGSTDPMILSYLPPLYSGDTIYDQTLAELQQQESLFSITQQNPIHHARQTPISPIAVASVASAPIAATLDFFSTPAAASTSSVSIPEGASFFQTYFEVIHPRYPFLDVEECSRAYLDWKTGKVDLSGSSGWSSYLVKMVSYSLDSRSVGQH